MRSERRKRIMTLSILIVSILVMSVGFAAFSTTLRIETAATINPDASGFSVKFSTTKDTLTEADVEPNYLTTGLTATNGEINNSVYPTISNLSAEFKSPGDTVIYKFYARNEGEYKAFLDKISFIGEKSCVALDGTDEELVASACNSISLIVTVAGTDYTDTTEITDHSLPADEGEEILITMEYASTGTWVDGPFTVELGSITMIYSTMDDSTYMPALETFRYYSWLYGYIGGDLPGDAQLTVSELELNPGYSFYIGLDVYSNNKVAAAYTCFVRNQTEYCLKGFDAEAYETNKTILEDSFKDVENACSDESDYFECLVDDLYVYADSIGYVSTVDVGVDDAGDYVINAYCEVDEDGDFECTAY